MDTRSLIYDECIERWRFILGTALRIALVVDRLRGNIREPCIGNKIEINKEQATARGIERWVE